MRLQCYEGLTANEALYDWNHQRQLLAIRVAESRHEPLSEDDLFSEEFLIERPILRCVRYDGPRPPVLLIDEVDRADDEFEALLLEALGEGSVTVPELGTFTAKQPPIVVLTSNRSRDLHDALRRRCLYHWLDFPEPERVVAILRRTAPVREPGPHRVGRPVRRPRPLARHGQAARASPRRSTGSRRCPRSGPPSWSGRSWSPPWVPSPRPRTTGTWSSSRSTPTRSAERRSSHAIAAADSRSAAGRGRPRGARGRAGSAAPQPRGAGDPDRDGGVRGRPGGGAPGPGAAALLAGQADPGQPSARPRGLRPRLPRRVQRRGARGRPAGPPQRPRAPRRAGGGAPAGRRGPGRGGRAPRTCPGTRCRGWPRPSTRPRSTRCPSCCRAPWRGSRTPRSRSSTSEELALLGRWLESVRAPLADPAQPPAAGPADGTPGRAARDDRRLAPHRLGADGAQALPPRAAPAHGHAGLRRQPVHAELLHRLPPPDAGLRRSRAARRRSRSRRR